MSAHANTTFLYIKWGFQGEAYIAESATFDFPDEMHRNHNEIVYCL